MRNVLQRQWLQSAFGGEDAPESDDSNAAGSCEKSDDEELLQVAELELW